MQARQAIDSGRRWAILLGAVFLVSPAAAADSPAQGAKERLALLKKFAGEFVEITPGRGKFPESFQMGSDRGRPSERPVHEVDLDYDFAIARYEVTQELYQAVTGNNPSVWQGPTRGRNSVEMVTWQDAVRFCSTVTGLLRDARLIGRDELIRLPSEAEWEYCCRAGTTTRYSFGDDATVPKDTGTAATRLDPFAWHTGNAAGNDPPVGALKPNPWGLYDMHGYLWEYTADAWHPDYRNAPADGSAWEAEAKFVQRVIRGGSWRDRYELLSSAARWSVPDHVQSDAIGFRCVKAAADKRTAR